MNAPVLLIEDDPDEAELFAIAAAEAGIACPVRVAHTGEEALELLRDGSFAPALTLLDLKMPGIGGLATLRAIRADPRLAKLVVVVLTSSALSEDKAAVEQLGCDEYISKPVTFDGYVAVASRLKSRLPGS